MGVNVALVGKSDTAEEQEKDKVHRTQIKREIRSPQRRLQRLTLLSLKGNGLRAISKS